MIIKVTDKKDKELIKNYVYHNLGDYLKRKLTELTEANITLKDYCIKLKELGRDKQTFKLKYKKLNDNAFLVLIEFIPYTYE